MKETIIFVLCAVSAIVLVMLGANALNHAQCRDNVQEMGREYRYSFIQGCRIGLEDGTFVYWKMFREIPD